MTTLTSDTFDQIGQELGTPPEVTAIAKANWAIESSNSTDGNLKSKLNRNGEYALGPMQMLPSTFKGLANAHPELGLTNITDPIQNAKAAMLYLTEGYVKSKGNLGLTYGYYFAGPKVLQPGFDFSTTDANGTTVKNHIAKGLAVLAGQQAAASGDSSSSAIVYTPDANIRAEAQIQSSIDTNVANTVSALAAKANASVALNDLLVKQNESNAGILQGVLGNFGFSTKTTQSKIDQIAQNIQVNNSEIDRLMAFKSTQGESAFFTGLVNGYGRSKVFAQENASINDLTKQTTALVQDYKAQVNLAEELAKVNQSANTDFISALAAAKGNEIQATAAIEAERAKRDAISQQQKVQSAIAVDANRKATIAEANRAALVRSTEITRKNKANEALAKSVAEAGTSGISDTDLANAQKTASALGRNSGVEGDLTKEALLVIAKTNKKQYAFLTSGATGFPDVETAIDFFRTNPPNPNSDIAKALDGLLIGGNSIYKQVNAKIKAADPNNPKEPSTATVADAIVQLTNGKLFDKYEADSIGGRLSAANSVTILTGAQPVAGKAELLASPLGQKLVAAQTTKAGNYIPGDRYLSDKEVIVIAQSTVQEQLAAGNKNALAETVKQVNRYFLASNELNNTQWNFRIAGLPELKGYKVYLDKSIKTDTGVKDVPFADRNIFGFIFDTTNQEKQNTPNQPFNNKTKSVQTDPKQARQFDLTSPADVLTLMVKGLSKEAAANFNTGLAQ